MAINLVYYTTHFTLLWMIASCMLNPVQTTVPSGCQGRKDIVFVIDGSESVMEHDPYNQPYYHWKRMQTLISDVLDSLPIEYGESKVALLTYSDTPYVHFSLSDQNSAAHMRQTVHNLQPQRGFTDTAMVLSYVNDHMFTGDRSDAENVVVLISDGLSNGGTGVALHRATDLKFNRQVKLHTIAMTPYIDEEELRDTASSDREFLQVDSESISFYSDTLLHRLCDLPDPEPPTTDNPHCEVRADVVLLADNSGSIRDKNPCPDLDNCDNYKFLKQFLMSLVDGMDVSTDKTRVSTIRFSSSARLEFYLYEHLTSDDVKRGIWDMAFDGSYTNIADAIRIARTQVFTAERGDRPDIRNVAILVTDGESTVNEDSTLREADLAKAEGINFFVVGMTDEINELELKSIASEPSQDHYFATADVQSLTTIQDEIVRLVCAGNKYR